MSDRLDELIAALSLKDLRAIIGEGGLSTDGCIDKSDLRGRAREAAERLKLPGAKLGAVSKPIISTLVAEELGLFDTPEEKAAKADAAAAEKAAKEAEEAAATAAKVAAAKEGREKVTAELAAKERAVQEAREKEKEAKEKAAKAKAKAAADADKKEKQQRAKAAAEVKAAEEKEAEAIASAVAASDVHSLTRLLETMRVDAKGSERGDTALMVAASKGNEPMVEALLAAGANPNVFNDDGQAPLHIVAMFNREKICKLLVDGRADVMLADANGQTPRTYAELNNRNEVAAILADAEANLEAVQAADRAKAAAAAAEQKAAADAKAKALSLVRKQVKISGLKARPDLNGLVGYVLDVTPNDRCTVAVKVGEALEQIALKPANLEQHDASDVS